MRHKSLACKTVAFTGTVCAGTQLWCHSSVLLSFAGWLADQAQKLRSGSCAVDVPFAVLQLAQTGAAATGSSLI
jgi:hypothetical protein